MGLNNHNHIIHQHLMNKPLPPKPKRKSTYIKKAARPKQRQQANNGLNPWVNSAARTIGGMAGSLIGIPSSIGSSMGDNAHRFFKSVTGYGEYKVKANSLMGSSGAPIFKANDRVMKIRHREFISDIFSGATLIGGATKFETYVIHLINPCNSGLFPWLSSIARNFQQYKFKGLLFAFESKSGNAISSTNAALGTVIMATNYNIAAPLFTNKQDMETHEFTTTAKSSDNMLHPIECSPKEQVAQHYYNANRALINGEDPKFYYPGLFQLVTIGQQATRANLGELWVTYDIELLKPRKDLTKASAHYYIIGNTMSSNMGTILFTRYDTSNFSSITLAPSTVVVLDNSFYGLIRVQLLVTSPAAVLITGYSVVLSGNAVLSPTFVNDSAGLYISGSAASQSYTIEVFVTGGGIITFNNIITSANDPDWSVDVFIDSIVQDDLH